MRAELEEDSALAEAVKASSGLDVLAPIDPMRLRDMYTYSRALQYNADGALIGETECFPDEQGRIGRDVSRISNPATGMERTDEATYVYNDEGTLQTIEFSNAVFYTITENTADHRKKVRGDMDMEYIEYYDEQGREIRQEHFIQGGLNSNTTFTYDTEGKLIRAEQYTASGALNSYSLYEYD